MLEWIPQVGKRWKLKWMQVRARWLLVIILVQLRLILSHQCQDSEEIDNIDEELSMIMKAIGISDVPIPRMSPNVEASANT
ncbi:unnamed protein product [Linum trigynum]